jgi:hypothetical protein
LNKTKSSGNSHDNNVSYLKKVERFNLARNRSLENNLTMDNNSDKIYYLNNDRRKDKKMSINNNKLNHLINIQESESHEDMNNEFNRSISSAKSASKLEKEMQRKVKSILKKDILGRYRKSPYLKNI